MQNQLAYQEVLILKSLFDSPKTLGQLFRQLSMDAHVIYNCLEELMARDLVEEHDEVFTLNYPALKEHYLGEFAHYQPELSLLVRTKFMKCLVGIN